MKIKMKPSFLIYVTSLLMAVCANASIVSGTGSPTYTNGWPEGAATVSNLKSCVGWWEGPPFGGGEWHIQFRGDAEALNEALTNFAVIKSPELDVVIHDGPKQDQFLDLNKKGGLVTDSLVDWEFVVWEPKGWNAFYSITNATFKNIVRDDPNVGKPAPAPLLNIYIGGGQVDWQKVKVPGNVRVSDERSKK